VAQDKADTSVGFGLATDGWHEFIKNDPPLAAGAVGGIARLVVFGGGYAIKVEDRADEHGVRWAAGAAPQVGPTSITRRRVSLL
jgi:hypothetical protein